MTPSPSDHFSSCGRWATLFGDPLVRVLELPDKCATQIWLSVGQWEGLPSLEQVQRLLAPKSVLCYHDLMETEWDYRRMVSRWTQPGDLVVDFTMGSASTGVACHHTGRRFVGVERDPTIYQTGLDRLLWLPEARPIP